jgi:hypothetical protein
VEFTEKTGSRFGFSPTRTILQTLIARGSFGKLARASDTSAGYTSPPADWATRVDRTMEHSQTCTGVHLPALLPVSTGAAKGTDPACRMCALGCVIHLESAFAAQDSEQMCS